MEQLYTLWFYASCWIASFHPVEGYRKQSFAAGFRLAYGFTREVESNSRYSYEEEETKKICQNACH